jgi:hypothetical protein
VTAAGNRQHSVVYSRRVVWIEDWLGRNDTVYSPEGEWLEWLELRIAWAGMAQFYLPEGEWLEWLELRTIVDEPLSCSDGQALAPDFYFLKKVKYQNLLKVKVNSLTYDLYV